MLKLKIKHLACVCCTARSLAHSILLIMTLLLDPDIRDWVVLPLFVIMVAAGLLRQYVGRWMQSAKVKTPLIASRSQNMLKQTTRIRSYGASHYMTTTWKWHLRRQHVVQQLRAEAEWCEEEVFVRKFLFGSCGRCFANACKAKD